MSSIPDDEVNAQAKSYAEADAANRGPRHAGITDEELCKALRHRAGLPETCATDAYVMLQAEQRINLRHQSNEGWRSVPVKPTLAMSIAGETEYQRKGLGVWSDFHAIYRAMIDAAPSDGDKPS